MRKRKWRCAIEVSRIATLVRICGEPIFGSSEPIFGSSERASRCGTGPRQASTIGIWSLASMNTVQAVMSDARYGEQVAYRDRIHDMPNAAMYLARDEFVGAAPAPGHVLLVGLVAMNPGSGFEEHQMYESTLAPITARHGMRLYRSYRVIQALSGVANNIAAINVWELPSPEALGQVMNDPDYVAQVPYRNRIHDMAATTMYFVSSRGEAR